MPAQAQPFHRKPGGCNEPMKNNNTSNQDSGQDSLLPVQDSAAEAEWAIEPTGAPEEFGIPQFSRPVEKRVWQRQEAYLAAYRECGDYERTHPAAS